MRTVLMAAGQLLQGRGAGSGNRLGQFEIIVVLALAEILRAEQLLGANDLRALSRGCGDAPQPRGQSFPPGRGNSGSE